MSTTRKRRILWAAPVAVALALTVSACGHITLSVGPDSGNTPASNSAATTNGSVSASGMSPDQVAGYCKVFATFVHPDQAGPNWGASGLVEIRQYTPVQLRPNVNLLITDYAALKKGNRVFVQLKDEMDAAYRPIQDFNDQICTVHERAEMRVTAA